MENSERKAKKKTTTTQFEVLVKQLEANPDLARGAPTFGADRVTVDDLWKKIAAKVNSYGPPQRSAIEWKKIWADLKSRTKKKIAENNASLHATGGGPFQCAPLSELEQTIDRILLMSKAAAPSGKILGFPSLQPIAQTAVQSEPQHTTRPILQLITQPMPQPIPQPTAPPATNTTPTRQTTDIPLTPTRQTTPIGVVTPSRVRSSTVRSSTTPNISRNNTQCVRRKRNFQEMIGESAREQAKAAKKQAEAAKEISVASKMQAEATKNISEALAKLVEITTRQTEAFEEFIKLMKNT